MDVLLITILILVLLVGFAAGGFALTIFWSVVAADAPWVPLSKRGIATMASFIGSSEAPLTIIDLGSGDGRVLRGVSRAVAGRVRGVGVEQSRVLTWFARTWSRITGHRNLTFSQGDFMGVPLQDVDVVLCYLWPEVMQTLGAKFERELTAGSRIIAAAFPIPGWRPSRVAAVPNVGTFYEYRIE